MGGDVKVDGLHLTDGWDTLPRVNSCPSRGRQRPCRKVIFLFTALRSQGKMIENPISSTVAPAMLADASE